jgi:hypothetical protein
MHSFKPAARRRGRIPRFLLLSLLAMTSRGLSPAHADGVSGTIDNGQTVNGTVTGSGIDSYTFNVMGGTSFVVSVSETGTHDATFAPGIDLVPPAGNGDGIGNGLHAKLQEINAAAGPWAVKVSRADESGSTTGGTYALTLIQVPGTISPSGGVVKGAMSPGGTYSGSITRGNIDVYTFTGVAGQTGALTLNATGGNAFSPEISVFTPTGASVGGIECVASCSQDVSITAAGTWTVLVDRQDNKDVSGTYTLSLNYKN